MPEQAQDSQEENGKYIQNDSLELKPEPFKNHAKETIYTYVYIYT